MTTSHDAEAGAVERVAAILSGLASAPGEIGPTALARSLGMPTATVHRTLQRLSRTGLVSYCSPAGTYSLGDRLLVLGLAVQEKIPLKREARRTLEQLREVTGESAAVFVRIGGNSYLALDQTLTLQQPKRFYTLGKLFPLHSAASGRAMLAFESPDFIERYLASVLLTRVDHTPLGPGLMDRGELYHDLVRIRESGFAVSFSETVPQSHVLAFPLMNAQGAILGSLSVMGPTERWTEAAMLSRVDECQAVIERLRERVSYMSPHREPGP